MGKYQYQWASIDRYDIMKEFAKQNRQNMTLAENFLWRQLMGNKIGGKFKRQLIIGDYIADFASVEKHLIIEVDGGYHSEPIQMQDDAQRTAWLNKMGWKVVRFTNDEVLYGIEEVVEKIKEILSHE